MIMLMVGLCAQTGFSYQAVLRGTDGTPRADETLNLTAELLQDDLVVYSEAHVAETNEFGAFTIIIGQGAGEQVYTPTIFLNSDSTGILQTVLKITESGGNVLSETNILGVPFAEVSKVALSAHVEFPAGVIFPFAGPADKIPPGWLLCNGDTLNKTDYPALFDVINISWGEPSPGTFNLPDLRGVFLRGVSGTGNDSFTDPDAESRISRHTGGAIGNNPGSYQTDEIESHNHDWRYGSESDDSGYGGSYSEFTFTGGSFNDASSPINYRGGNETRPSNAYVHYIIKY
jgi:hypothetical protein